MSSQQDGYQIYQNNLNAALFNKIFYKIFFTHLKKYGRALK